MTDAPFDSDIAPELQVAPPPQRQTRRGPRSQTTREPMRDAPRDGVYRGRDGEILTRKRTTTGDIFKLPEEMENDPEWEYQWNAVSVHGNQEILLDQNLMMGENGWRPVPADRPGIAGRFAPIGTKGSIIRGGQRLDERPRAMCDAARSDEYRRATGQMSDNNESLMGRKANLRGAMNNGMAMDRRYRGTGGRVNMSIDHGRDIPRPQHELAMGDE